MVSPRSAAATVQPIGTGRFDFPSGAAATRSLWCAMRRLGHAWPLGEVTFKFIADPTAAYAALMAAMWMPSPTIRPESFLNSGRSAL